jgi:hypothetical protein
LWVLLPLAFVAVDLYYLAASGFETGLAMFSSGFVCLVRLPAVCIFFWPGQAQPGSFEQLPLWPPFTFLSGAPQQLMLALGNPLIGATPRCHLPWSPLVDGVKQPCRWNGIHLGRLDGDECRWLYGHGSASGG